MLRTLSVIAVAIAMSSVQAAAAATSPGVTITLACEIGTVGTGTFKVTANGSSSLATVPCGGSATATNAAWMPEAEARIDQTAGPAGTAVGTPPPRGLPTPRAPAFAAGAAFLSGVFAPRLAPAGAPPGEAT